MNISVLPEAFSEALQADLSLQYDREEMARWLGEGAASPRDGCLALAAQWTALRDAVTVCTRQMRRHGYYPEQVLVAIKSAVRHAAGSLVSGQLAEVVVREAAQSSIRTYFERETDQAMSTYAAQAPVVAPSVAAAPQAVSMIAGSFSE